MPPRLISFDILQIFTHHHPLMPLVMCCHTGTVVGKVEAIWQGLTPITYSVQEDDGENLFLLSPLSGEFLLSRSLDFEAQRFYVLTVAVQQGDIHVSSVRVYVNVLNVNDNPPVFSGDSFSVSLLEDTQVGTCFLSLNVSDKDEGKCTEKTRGTQGRVFFSTNNTLTHMHTCALSQHK